MSFALPRDVYDDLISKIGRESAEKIMSAFETILDSINKKTDEQIIEKKEIVKNEVYSKLKNELATKEFVRAETNEIKAEFEGLKADFEGLKAEFHDLRGEVKEISLLLKVLIGISTFALTIFNPNFINLIEKIFKG